MDKYVGKRLDGRYEIQEIIGVGGMAYVYKAYDAVDDRIVAVKILKDEFLNNEEFVRRFRNESKAIAILNHPNIVKVLDVGFGERLQYIVMEYVDGITLKDFIRSQKIIPAGIAIKITMQILSALQHAHERGVIHRDIKPDNILFVKGVPKLADIGLVSSLSASVTRLAGTLEFIPPEERTADSLDSSDRRARQRNDLYAFGKVF